MKLTEADLMEIEARVKESFGTTPLRFALESQRDIPALLAEVRYLRAALIHINTYGTTGSDVGYIESVCDKVLNGTWDGGEK